jgi:hypothetical protein
MRTPQSEPSYKRPRIASTAPEFGDCTDVRRVFGFRESFTYHLFKSGQIKSVLIPGTGKKGGTGKRLFSFASIRQLIAKRAKQQESMSK